MATFIDKARSFVGKTKDYLDADPNTQGYQFGVPSSLSKLPGKITGFVQQNPTPAGFIGSKLPQSIRQPIEQNLGRLRNVDIASTAVGGAMKNYLDTRQMSPLSPQRIIAQNFPAVGAVQNIFSQKPTFASEQIQRAIPGNIGKAVGFGAEVVLPGFGGEIKAAQGVKGIAKSLIKQSPRAVLSGAGEAQSLSQIPSNVGTNLLLAGGLTALSPIVNKALPNAKGMVFGKNRNTGWISDEARVYDDSIDALNANANLLGKLVRGEIKKDSYEFVKARQLLTSIEDNLGSLADNHIPNSTLKKLGEKYGNNSVGYLKALGEELQKSLRSYEDKGGIVLGIYGGPKAQGFKNEGSFSSMADKKVRFEIDDSKAKLADDIDEVFALVGSGNEKLKTVLKHDTLFKQYPELNDADVIFKRGGTGAGSFVADGGDGKPLISINLDLVRNKKELKSTLLHEIQHAIQEKEGFARGGSPDQFSTLKEIQNDLFPLKDKLRQTKADLETAIDLGYSKNIIDKLRKTEKELTDQISSLSKQLNSYVDPSTSYQRLAGEIEARDVQARMNLTPEQRATTLPYKSQGIPVKDQIVRFDGGVRNSQPLRKARPGSYTNVPEIDNPLLKQKPDEILNEARQSIRPTQSKSKTIGQAWKQFYTDMVNRFQPVEDIVNKIQKTTKSEIIPEFNPKTQILRLLGAGGVAEQRHRKILDPVLKQIPKEVMGDFDVYLKARRDVGFGKIGREIFGSDPVKAQAVIDALGSKHDLTKFDAVAQQLYKYQDENLSRLVQEGFIDQDTFNAIKGANPDYVPFQRVMDDLDNFIGLPTRKLSQGKQPIGKIEGSERAVLSPIESIIADTYKMEAAVAKNRVARSIGQLSQILPDIGIRQVAKSSETTIPVWQGGKKTFFEVPEDVSKVVKGLNEEQQSQLVKILSVPASILRQGATGRNIDFMIPNIMRDQFDAALNSKYGYRPFIDYFNGLAELIKYKTGKPSLYEDWANSGGKIFYEMAGGRKAIANEISDATKQKSMGRKFFNALVSGLDTLGEFSETPTRLGLYKKAFEKTGNKFISAQEAREGTLDFARMGAKMKTLNAIIPFLNVGVQGFDKLLRTAKNQPQKLLLYGAIYGIAPQIALTIYNNTYHSEEYKEIPDEVKQDNFVLVTGRNKDGRVNYLTLAKGNVLPYITNPADNLLSVASGYDAKSFSNLALTLLGEALPLVEPGKDLQQTASRSIGSIIPQAVKPTIETLANYSFYKGREIVPSYMQNKPPVEQAYNFTETPYKYLGNLLQVSPLVVKNFVEGTVAGYVKTPMQVASIAQKISRGEQPSPNEVPVLRRFLSETYDTGEEFQKKQQKEQERIAKEEEKKQSIPPLQKRLFGQVSAAEEAMPEASTTIGKLIQKQANDSKMVSDYKDIITGKKKVKDVEAYLKETYGVSSKDIELRVMKNLDVATRTPAVFELIRNKNTTVKDLEQLVSNAILTDDVAKKLYEDGSISGEAYGKLKSYMKWVKGGKQKKVTTGTGGKGRKRSRPRYSPPKITLRTIRPKQYKKLTLRDLYSRKK